MKNLTNITKQMVGLIPDVDENCWLTMEGFAFRKKRVVDLIDYSPDLVEVTGAVQFPLDQTPKCIPVVHIGDVVFIAMIYLMTPTGQWALRARLEEFGPDATICVYYQVDFDDGSILSTTTRRRL